MSTAAMGIDPGVRGGLAVLRPDGSPAWIRAFDPNMLDVELVEEVWRGVLLLKAYGSSSVWVERVGYMPTDGGRGAFTFGRVVGLLLGAAYGCEGHVTMVSPMMWQSAMECLTGGNKNVSKRRATELFPREKITHAVADALLIAEYGRRRLAQMEKAE